MRMFKKILWLLILVLLVGIVALPWIMQVATAAGSTIIKGTKNPLINPNAPPDGTVTITSPQNGEIWYKGSRHEIQWTGTGKGASLMGATLWMNNKLVITIGTEIGSGTHFLNPQISAQTVINVQAK